MSTVVQVWLEFCGCMDGSRKVGLGVRVEVWEEGTPAPPHQRRDLGGGSPSPENKIFT